MARTQPGGSWWWGVASIVVGLSGLMSTGGCGRCGESDAPRRRVLVTGFSDWKDLGDPPNIWRCRDNPSCRLLVGQSQVDKPSMYDGALAKRLRAQRRDIDWIFATLPVTWEAARELPLRTYDAVIHLGLGVYDSTDTILVENGAYNLRRGKDALGHVREESIADPQPGEIANVRASTGRSAERIAAVTGRSFSGYQVERADAREKNTYLCNETHFLALGELEKAGNGDRLQQVHFVHLPYAVNDDYAALADGVVGVVDGLLGQD